MNEKKLRVCFTVLFILLFNFKNVYFFVEVSTNSLSVPEKSVNQNEANQFQWQPQEKKVIESQGRFNWYRRKMLKNQVYDLYATIVNIINSIKKSVTLFQKKTEEILALKQEFETELKNKYYSLNKNYTRISDFSSFLTEWKTKIIFYKKSSLYTNNKEFRKKIDSQEQHFQNIENMISHYNNSFNDFFILIETLSFSLTNLDTIVVQASKFEEEAWIKYQELDELINDNNAQNNFLKITDCLENVINYNKYIRQDFLEFFNNGLYNLSQGKNNILAAIDDLIMRINEIDLRMKNFEIEINLHNDEQKNKILLAEQEKELEIKSKEEIIKKKREAEIKKQNEKKWYEKIIPTVGIYSGLLQGAFLGIYQSSIDKISYYYERFFNKSDSNQLKKHKPNVKELGTTEVSKNISDIPVLQDKNQEIVLINTPQSTKGVSFNKAELEQNNTIAVNSNNIVPSEDFDNVLERQHYGVPVKEMDKTSGSSYPKKLFIPQQTGSTQSLNSGQNGEILLLSSEDLPLQEQINGEVKSGNVDHDLFRYSALEEKAFEQKDNLKLLPDLSQVPQPKILGVDRVEESGANITAFEAPPKKGRSGRANNRSEYQKSHHNNSQETDDNSEKIHKKEDRQKKINKKTKTKKKVGQQVKKIN